MPLPYAVFLATFAAVVIASVAWQFGKRDEEKRQGSWVDNSANTILEGVSLAWWIALLIAAAAALIAGWLQ